MAKAGMDAGPCIRQDEVRTRPHWMVGAPTALVDSWSPRHELIQLPPLVRPAHEIEVRFEEGDHAPPARKLEGLRRLKRMRIPTVEIDEPFYDARNDTQANICHVVHRQTAFAIQASAVLEERGVPPVRRIVMAASAPKYAQDAARLFGMEPTLTDGIARGPRVAVDAAPCFVLGAKVLAERLRETRPDLEPGSDRRLFVARRGARSLENHESVASWLQERGFRCVFMEDHSVEEQLRLMAGAEEVVGVHGAGLTFMSVRLPGSPALRVVEVYGPGYIVSGFRAQVDGVGGHWAGVRGVVTPEVVRDVVHKGLSRAHEGSDFVVEPSSLGLALDIVRGGEPEVEPIWIGNALVKP